MRFSFIYHAPAGDVFAQAAFDSQVGTEVQFRAHSGRPNYAGVLTAAEVIEDGRAARLTLDLPDDATIDVRDEDRGYSVGFDA